MEPDNDTLLFLCYGACRQTIEQAFDKWAVSPEGEDFYRRTLVDLHKAQTSEETILKMVALLWYVRLLPYTADEVSEPVHGSYLLDFGRLLDGQQLKNQRAALERMALSTSRVAGEGCDPAILYLLNSAFAVQLPLHWLDGSSDQYWKCRLSGGMAHGSAWQETESGYKEGTGRVSESAGVEEASISLQEIAARGLVEVEDGFKGSNIKSSKAEGDLDRMQLEEPEPAEQTHHGEAADDSETRSSHRDTPTQPPQSATTGKSSHAAAAAAALVLQGNPLPPPCAVILQNLQNYIPLRRILTDSKITLLTPVIVPPDDTAGSKDPFEPFGRTLAMDSKVRHVPYTKSGGITETHVAFIRRADVALSVFFLGSGSSESTTFLAVFFFSEALLLPRSCSSLTCHLC
jgi:hypothetical protein